MQLTSTRAAFATLSLTVALGACRSVNDAQPTPARSSLTDERVDAPATAARPGSFAAPGTKAELGEPAPDFTLQDLAGTPVTLGRRRGKIVVLEWFSPDCPYSKYAHAAGPLKTLPADLKRQGVVWLTINSEAPDSQGGNPDLNRDFVAQHALQAPLLFDPTGAVGRAYGAKSTPHLFVINERGKLVYRGALDNAPLGTVSGDLAKTNYVEAAISDLKSGHAVATRETRAYGTPVHYQRP